MRALLPLTEWFRRVPRRSSEKARECRRETWAEDPLSHPALRNMTLEQLADLPFERGSAPTTSRRSP